MSGIAIDQNLCKGCELCVSACPLKIIAMSGKFDLMGYQLPVLTNEQRCTGCALCAIICPDAAVEVYGD
ncbi:MAG: 4Fe-4S binding protein [Chloroflexota bacterium]